MSTCSTFTSICHECDREVTARCMTWGWKEMREEGKRGKGAGEGERDREGRVGGKNKERYRGGGRDMGGINLRDEDKLERKREERVEGNR